jgi:hypothetical protein
VDWRLQSFSLFTWVRDSLLFSGGSAPRKQKAIPNSETQGTWGVRKEERKGKTYPELRLFGRVITSPRSGELGGCEQPQGLPNYSFLAGQTSRYQFLVKPGING